MLDGLELVDELPVERVADHPGRGEERAEQHRAGHVVVEWQGSDQGAGGRPHQRLGMDDIPPPHGGEEFAYTQVDLVGAGGVAVQALDREQVVRGAAVTVIVDLYEILELELAEEMEPRTGIGNDEEAQVVPLELRGTPLVADQIDVGVAAEGERGVANLQPSAESISEWPDGRLELPGRASRLVRERVWRLGRGGGRHRRPDGQSHDDEKPEPAERRVYAMEPMALLLHHPQNMGAQPYATAF